MADFNLFAVAVRRRFREMSKEPLFQVAIDRDTVWLTYLYAFPEGTDPIFRTRSEHDCSCCRAFIRNTGGVVAIQNGTISTIWDLNGLPEPYQTVADAMAAHIKSLPIRDSFLTALTEHGTPISREYKDDKLLQFHHFHVEIPKEHIVKKADLGEQLGYRRTTHEVLLRGLAELSAEAVSTTADLITSGSLYRGQEFFRAVSQFSELQKRFAGLDDKGRELLAWTAIDSPVARFRNTVIGTLVQDLSDGVDIEQAVKSYELKVAPANYKRSSSLITPQMVKNAMKTIEELGLEQALERRHARLADVSVNSVLFVDGSVRGLMKGGIEDLLMQEVKPVKFDPARAEEIGIDAFVRDVLPKTKAIQLYLHNGLLNNFMSLTAPVHEGSPQLFKWSNGFAWSYEGNYADSIKEKVKRAGGKVDDVALRVSLEWYNYDDLDLHCLEPNGNHIYFHNKCGILDIDMNAGGSQTREPVENMRWVYLPCDGVYHFYVHNYCKRESKDVGFAVEIATLAGVETLRYDKAVPDRATQQVAAVTIRGGKIEQITPVSGMISGSRSQEQWGLKTLSLVKVNSIVLSPNYWDDNATGNKHFFFILDGCRNPLPTRGFYNEMLIGRLEPHRKVFEVLAEKTKCPPVDEQMSGVGFSSTKKDRVTVQVTGTNLNRSYTIVF